MATESDEEARRAIEAHLHTLQSGGALRDSGLDATITPSAEAGAAGAGFESMGPLPLIALSGEARPGGSERSPATGTADFEMLAVLGEGGMGRVHLARQRSLGREVAIKTLKEEVGDPRVSAMLRAEATTMGRLEHPNVVPVHAVGVDDRARLVLVMKRIDGVSWRTLLRDPAHPRWATLAPDADARLDAHLDVLVQVANALHFAHQSGIVHRDVKPENVLLGAHSEVYLADWGVALRLEDRGGPTQELVGTPAYMAPEMVVGDRAGIDPRTDVFLLGATLHEVLTGAPPHFAADVQAALRVAHAAVPPKYGDDVPRELAAIATRAMAPRPDDRFPTALAFRQAIDDTRRHRGSIALTRSGRAILTELGPLLDRERSGAPDATLDRRLTECRFALVQALRDWPDNPEARLVLDACLRLSIDHELSRENAGAAEALLAELSEPDSALRQRIAALSAALEARKAEAQRLRQHEADQDLGVGYFQRAATVTVLMTVALSISAVALLRLRSGSGIFAAQELVLAAGLLFFVALVPTLLLRRRLLANVVGRQATALLLISTGAMFLHRIVAASWGVAPEATLSMDIVLCAAMLATMSLVIPRAGLAALLPLGGALLAATTHWYPSVIFSVSVTLGFLLTCLIWFVEMKGKAPPR